MVQRLSCSLGCGSSQVRVRNPFPALAGGSLRALRAALIMFLSGTNDSRNGYELNAKPACRRGLSPGDANVICAVLTFQDSF